ncbi:MAG: flagellar hook-basal body protein [Chthoniobacteraceae bacterium]
MNIGIYKSASAMVALDRWQESISQNIASASVPGFRKTEGAFASKSAELERFGADGRSVKEARGVMPTATSQISLQPGELRATGNETDFAIQGRGFFKVQLEKGKVGYTRDGEFHLNAERTLVNKAGRPVFGDGGPIVFKPEGGKISLSADGTLVQGEAAVGKLPIYDFKDTDKLRRMGDGLLNAEDEKVQPKLVETPEIINGVLEMSNVQPLQEMVNMITVARAYEANQKVIISGNDLLEKAIQSLGASA